MKADRSTEAMTYDMNSTASMVMVADYPAHICGHTADGEELV
jgi:hypothetical protein